VRLELDPQLKAVDAAFRIRLELSCSRGLPVDATYRGAELSFFPSAHAGDILQTLQLVDRYNELRDRYETLFRDTVGIDLAAARERQLDAEKAPITELQATPPG
jgi:hypothetical protein